MAKTTKPKEQPTADLYANLSIHEIMDRITQTTEELQEVIRKLDDLTEDTAAYELDVKLEYERYQEAQNELNEHLKRVEEKVQNKTILSQMLAGYSDAFKSRME